MKQEAQRGVVHTFKGKGRTRFEVGLKGEAGEEKNRRTGEKSEKK